MAASTTPTMLYVQVEFRDLDSGDSRKATFRIHRNAVSGNARGVARKRARDLAVKRFLDFLDGAEIVNPISTTEPAQDLVA